MRRALVGFLCAAVALLAGCGGGGSGNGEADKTPSQIVADAHDAAKNASAVHVFGSGTTDSGPLKLDLYLVAGKGGRGHLSVNGLSFDMIRIGDKAYIRGGAGFWRQFGAGPAVSLLQGRWLTASADTGQLAAFAPLTDISKLFDAILGNHGKLSKGKPTDVGDRSAIPIVDQSKSGGTLYVATTGKPYPLQLMTGEGTTGTITFAGWDKPVALTAPKNPVDLSKLKALGG